jgi:hypothetical protein
VGTQVGGLLRFEDFCDELLTGASAFVVGAAESQVGRVRGDARVEAAKNGSG